MGLSIKIFWILAILVAVAYTLETANNPVVEDLGMAGGIVLPESVAPDLTLAEHKKKKYKKGRGYGHGHGGGGGGGGGGSSEERR